MAFAQPKTSARSSQADFEINPKLTDARREKLLNLKKREELKNVLIDKFRKVNDIDATSDVERFMGRAKMTQSNLQKLEKIVMQKADRAKGVDADQQSNVSEYSCFTAMSRASKTSSRAPRELNFDNTREADVEGGLAITGTKMMASIPEDQMVNQDPVDQMTWGDIAAYAVDINAQESIVREQKKQRDREQLKKDLDQQILQRQKEKLELVEEDKIYHENMIAEQKIHLETEKQKLAEQSAKLKAQGEDRLIQIDYNLKLVEARVEKEKKEDEEHLRQNILDIQKAAVEAEKKKAAAKAKYKANQEQNIRDKAIKEAAAVKAMEAELENIREFNRLAEEQEKARILELEARNKRQKALTLKMQETVCKEQDNRGAKDEERARLQREEADMRALQIDANKRAKQKAMTKETNDFLLQQIREKDQRKFETNQLKALLSQVYEEDAREYNKKQEETAAHRNDKYQIHQEGLKEQIAARAEAKKYEKVEMSEIERKLNYPLLAEAFNHQQAKMQAALEATGEVEVEEN